MTEELKNRCGTCMFFRRLRVNDEGVSVGECKLGIWVRAEGLPETSTCSSYATPGMKKPTKTSSPRRTKRTAVTPPIRKPFQLPQEIDIAMSPEEFRTVLKEVIREELGTDDIDLAEKWRGGEVVMKPGKEGVQEKTLSIDSFFHKVVMVRDKLRVLEQKINSSKLADDEKVQLQQYITGCYGSLTTFNVLFNNRESGFVGQTKKS